MAKVENQDVPILDKIPYERVLKPANRFVNISTRTKGFFNSRKRRKKLISYSNIPYIASLWRGLTDVERASWETAAANSLRHGFQVFVQDTALRLKLSLPGLSTPNNQYQSYVGHVNIPSRGGEARLIQAHDPTYYILRKVFNTQTMYEPVLITEGSTEPITFSISHNDNLDTGGGSGFAILTISYKSGTGPFDNLDFDFFNLDLGSGWERQTFVGRSLPVGTVCYNMEIVFFDVSGDFWFDNIVAEHDGANWALDENCERVGEQFKKGAYDFFPSWSLLPGYDPATCDSVFYH